LQGRDWWGALGVLLLVFLSTLPVVLPFVFARDPMRALRISNAIAIGMLFLTGYAFGRSTGYRPWAMGIAMVGVGWVLVGLTIALGG
jgi:VIT1/CCC1 family predicted Fe2+/Mn2+ transporter